MFVFASHSHVLAAVTAPPVREPVTVPEPVSLDVINEALSAEGVIQKTLDGAMCGGTSANQSINSQSPNSPGKIARINGAPGRRGDPLANITSGMAQRMETGGEKNDGYQFPSTAKGLVTTCRPYKRFLPNGDKNRVYATEQFTNIVKEVEYPETSNNPCQSYADATFPTMTIEQCFGAHNYMNTATYTWLDCVDASFNPITGQFTCTQYAPKWVCSGKWVSDPGKYVKNSEQCRGAACRCDGPGCKFGASSFAPGSTTTPAPGAKYLSYFRDYTVYSQREKVTEVLTDKLASTGSTLGNPTACAGDTAALTQAIALLNAEQEKLKQLKILYKPLLDAYESVKQQFEFSGYIINALNTILADPQKYADAQGIPVEQVIAQATALLKTYSAQRAKLALEYVKLFLQTQGPRAEILAQERKVEEAQTKVDELQDNVVLCEEKSSVKVPVACYGMYNEFDPKVRVTSGGDQRCVMRFPLAKEELRESQKGKGATPTTVPELPRQSRNPTFDPKVHLWYPNLGGGMSLLSDAIFQKTYKGDLTQALLRPDTADIQASYQRLEAPPYAKTNQLRAFDETVAKSETAELDRKDARSLTQWWQRFQSDADRFFSPPKIHLRLPDTWIFAAEDLPVEEGTDIVTDPRSQTIDIQLNANEDLLGEVAAFIEKSLLMKIQQEPVRVVVPYGTALEFRTAAERWNKWREERKLQNLEIPKEVDELVERLEEYAVQIERVRLLRTELTRGMGDVLTNQDQILLGLSKWVTNNLDTYKVHLEERQKRLSLLPTYTLLAKEYARFSDDINMPWCRNDRFTTPIYSMLDPWFPRNPTMQNGAQKTTGLTGGAPGCSNSATGLPLLCAPLDEQDLVLDFSHLRVMSHSIIVPVIDPTQIRIEVALPGHFDQTFTKEQLEALVPPPLPPVPTLDTNIIKDLPKITVLSEGPVIPGPQVMNLQSAFRSILRAFRILGGMNQTYETFWKSLDATLETNVRTCEGFGKGACIHVETDLIERLTRIMARPMILLKEDLTSVGIPMQRLTPTGPMSVTCNPADHTCVSLKAESIPAATGWQIVPPETPPNTEGEAEEARKQMRQKTVTDDFLIQEDIPYMATPEELLQIYPVPDAINLQPSSSSTNP